MASFKNELRRRIRPGHAESLAWFFKAGPGEYGEGDRFLGIRVPDIRAVAKMDDGQSDIRGLMTSGWHEERLLALLVLVRRFERGDEVAKKATYDFYLSSTRWINNWDLVDLSAYKIVGAWLLGRSRAPVRNLATSRNLWERRIAVVSTDAFIRAGDFEETFFLSRKLLNAGCCARPASGMSGSWRCSWTRTAVRCRGRCFATRSRNSRRSAANSSSRSEKSRDTHPPRVRAFLVEAGMHQLRRSRRTYRAHAPRGGRTKKVDR